MHHRHRIAFGAMLLALTAVLISAGAALAGSSAPNVTVRIEGKSRTLLSARTVRPGSSPVRKGGHSCSPNTGAGALQAATRGAWSGSWSSSLSDWDVTKVLGETDNYNTTKTYWEVFVDNVPASTGICGVKLHAGEQLLFAAVGASESPADPLGLKLIGKPVAGEPFEVQVVYYNAKGKATPLAGATVTAGGISAEPIPDDRLSATTDSGGVATLTESRTGLIQIGASKHGYIRAATVAADVTQ